MRLRPPANITAVSIGGFELKSGDDGCYHVNDAPSVHELMRRGFTDADAPSVPPAAIGDAVVAVLQQYGVLPRPLS
jgi:hypothetical protein